MFLLILQAAKVSAEGLAFMAAAFLTPYLTHITKNYLGVDSMWAYTLTLLFSVGLSAGALVATSELTLSNVVNQAGLIFTLSQGIFQVSKMRSGLKVGTDPKETQENDATTGS